MAKRVQLPDGSLAEFPDAMTPAQIEAVLKRRFGMSEPSTLPEGRIASGQPSGTPGPYGTRAPEIVGDSLVDQGVNAASSVWENLRGRTPAGAEAVQALKAGGQFGLAQALGIGLPVAGAIGGAAGGTALFGPAGTVAGGLAGETAGSYAARRANVALGLEEPGVLGDVAAVALPGVGQVAGKVASAVGRRLPGVGTALMEEGVEKARGLYEGLRPRPKSDVLYAQVAQQNAPVSLPHMAQKTREILAEEAKMPKVDQLPFVRDQAEALADIAAQGTDFQTIWHIQRRMRDHLWNAKGEERRLLGELDAALWKDFDAMAQQGNWPSRTLKEANKSYRKERAVDDLREIIEGSLKDLTQGAEGGGRVSADAMLKKFDKHLRDDDLFAGAWTRDEIKDIRDTFTQLSRIPVPGAGAAAGAMYGSAFGLGSGGLTGALTGSVEMAGAAAFLPIAMSFAMDTKAGRALVKGLAKSGRLWTPTGAAALRAFARTAGQEAVEQ